VNFLAGTPPLGASGASKLDGEARLLTATLWQWVVAGLLLGVEGAQRPPLRLDLEKHAADVVAHDAKSGLPHFGTSVEVLGRSPQTALEEQLKSLELDCGGPATGVPTHFELRQFMPGNGPYLDLTQLATMLLMKKLTRNEGPGRYVLYRVHRNGQASYWLRDGPLPEAWHHNLPGTVLEEIRTFADLKVATEALKRMERGFATPLRTKAGDPPPPWALSTCLPK
jgi:hypothetical protein